MDTNITDTIKKCRELANIIYRSEDYKKAYNYYARFHDMFPDDVMSSIYCNMCLAWGKTIDSNRVLHVFRMYKTNIERLISEDSLNDFCLIKDIIYLAQEWFHESLEKMWGIYDWYLDDLQVYFELKGRGTQIVNAFDDIKKQVFASTDVSVKSFFGKVYCDACMHLCQSYVVWTDKSKRNYKFYGPTSAERKKYVDGYDDMIFEVRKEDSSFRRLDIRGTVIWGLIDRMETPTRIGRHNYDISKQNEQLCLQREKEIDEKVEQWKKDESTRLQSNTLIQMLEEEPEEKVRFEELRKKVQDRTLGVKTIESDMTLLDNEISKLQKDINEITINNEVKEREIKKLQRSIFGRANARERIVQLQKESEEQVNSIMRLETLLKSRTTEYEEKKTLYSQAIKDEEDAKSAFVLFVKEYGFDEEIAIALENS